MQDQLDPLILREKMKLGGARPRSLAALCAYLLFPFLALGYHAEKMPTRDPSLAPTHNPTPT